jgi:hypothetical protein
LESRLVGLKSRNDVVRFAREIGVSPGVVVGRLQHDREDFRTFGNLKRSITPSDIEEM